MRYRIYGTDLYHSFIRKLDLSDDPTPEDIADVIEHYWNALAAFRNARRSHPTARLITAMDKGGSISLMIQSPTAFRRIGFIIPETHPIFNFTYIQSESHRFYKQVSGQASSYIRLGNYKYLVDTINDFVDKNDNI